MPLSGGLRYRCQDRRRFIAVEPAEYVLGFGRRARRAEAGAFASSLLSLQLRCGCVARRVRGRPRTVLHSTSRRLPTSMTSSLLLR
jgi:hypothetical protein